MHSHCFLRCDPFLDLNFIKKSLIDKKNFLLRNIWFLKFWSFEILISTFETLEKNSFLNLEFKIWNFEPLEFLKSRLGILIMKFEVWVFIENWRVEFNIWALRIWIWKFGNKNFWVENLGFKIFENFKKESFFLGWLSQLNLT